MKSHSDKITHRSVWRRMPLGRCRRVRALLGRVTVLLLASLWSTATAASPNGEAGVFRAGASSSNITPELGMPIVGGWSPLPAQHVHDELFARSVVLDDGNTRIVFVVCDNLGIPREIVDEAKRLIEKETGLPPGAVVIASTHTHSGPRAQGYRDFLIR